MMHLFQRSIENFRNRLVWIYRTYFSEEERVGIGPAVGTKVILVSTRGLHWPHSRLIRRSCFDCGVFVVSPLTVEYPGQSD